MYRVALSLKTGKITSSNFDNRDSAEAYVLEQAETHGISVGWLVDLSTGKRDKYEEYTNTSDSSKHLSHKDANRFLTLLLIELGVFVFWRIRIKN